jgi:hypothetical protein
VIRRTAAFMTLASTLCGVPARAAERGVAVFKFGLGDPSPHGAIYRLGREAGERLARVGEEPRSRSWAVRGRRWGAACRQGRLRGPAKLRRLRCAVGNPRDHWLGAKSVERDSQQDGASRRHRRAPGWRERGWRERGPAPQYASVPVARARRSGGGPPASSGSLMR